MKLKLAMPAMVLVLVACDAGEPASGPNVVQVGAESGPEVAFPADDSDPKGAVEKPPADGWADGSAEDWLEVDTHVVLVGPAERDRIRVVLPWEATNHEDRRKRLEGLAERGSEWAKETLRKLDDGEIHPSELDDSADAVAEESRNYPPRVRAGSRVAKASDNGCAPMPFGGSSFGPWDTGTGSSGQ